MTKQQVKCPRCLKRGHLRGRKDAYADYKIFIDNPKRGFSTRTATWKYASTAVMDDVQCYECFNCNATLESEEISKFNNVTL